MTDEPTIRIRDGSMVTREEYDMMEAQAKRAANRQAMIDSCDNYSDLVDDLRAGEDGLEYAAADALAIQAIYMSKLYRALGLLTTLNPTMEVDADDPVGMAQKIVSHVEARIAALEAALKPFADKAFVVTDLPDNWQAPVSVGDLRAARAAMEGKDD